MTPIHKEHVAQSACRGYSTAMITRVRAHSSVKVLSAMVYVDQHGCRASLNPDMPATNREKVLSGFQCMGQRETVKVLGGTKRIL
jgi:hypothetical protein